MLGEAFSSLRSLGFYSKNSDPAFHYLVVTTKKRGLVCWPGSDKHLPGCLKPSNGFPCHLEQNPLTEPSRLARSGPSSFRTSPHAILAGSCSHHMGFLSVFEHATLIPAFSLKGPLLIFLRDLLFTTKSQLKHLLSEIPRLP